LACVLAIELILASIALVGPGRSAPASSTHPGAPAAVNTVAPRAIADRTVRMVNLGGPGSAVLLSRITADMGQAVQAVEAFWGTDWPRDITVVATGSQHQFETEAGGGPSAQWADIAAVAVADRVDPARRIAGGQRIVFAPGAVAMSERALRIVLSHELFHYAARADTALDAPRWLTEGVADYVARPPAPIIQVDPLPAALPSDAELGAPGPQRSQAYDRAWWFARFVADTHGTATLRALYLAACGVGHSDSSNAMRAVLGNDQAGVLADWRQWLVRQSSR
jgi:hypothetical protein